MRVAYLEPSGGLSGDMMLGALVDCGLPLEKLQEVAEALGIADEVEISARKVTKASIAAAKVDVERRHHHHHHHGEHGHHHGRSAGELMEVVEGAELDDAIVERSLAIIRALAEAEAKVHDSTPEEVHFHELGGLDTLVDVVGAVVGLQWLGVGRLHCAPLPIGHGWIEVAHGRLPVPAPATAALLRGVPTVEIDVEGETVTPTGAALASALSDDFGRPADFVADVVGYGAGNADFDPVPNVVRLSLSVEHAEARPEIEEASRVAVIEANVDDMTGELASVAIQAALDAGALDAWAQPIVMKKGRPALLLRALSELEHEEAVVEALLRETTSLGVRMARMDRRCLPRARLEVETELGSVGVKVGWLDGRPVTVSPEFEDCRGAAERAGVPIKVAYAAATAAAHEALQLRSPAGDAPPGQ